MDKDKSNYSVYDTAIRLILLLLLIAACMFIMTPFVNVMLWSIILALAFLPLHKRLANRLGGKRKLASFIIVATILLILIIPVWSLSSSLIEELKELKVHYDNKTLSIPPPNESVKGWPIVGETFYNTWFAASENLEKFILNHKDHFIEVGKTVYKGIAGAIGGIFQLIAALILSGVILVNSRLEDAIRTFFRKVAGQSGDEFTELTMRTVRSVVKGVFGESLIMAMLYGTIFYFADLPYAGVWTLVIFMTSVLQLPLSIISAPIMIYFFAEKEFGSAVFWAISLFLVGLSNNVLTPLMLGKGAPVPMPVIFIGVFGGFVISGFIGLFTGAIIMSLGYTLFVGWINSNDAESLPE